MDVIERESPLKCFNDLKACFTHLCLQITTPVAMDMTQALLFYSE